MQSQAMEAINAIGVFCLVGIVLYMLLNGYRGRQQTELQRALIERFSSATDFAAFVQTEAGQRFVAELSGVSSPVRSVVRAVQAGIVVASLGAGFLSMHGAGSLAQVLSGLGLLLVCAGSGLLFSAGVVYVLSRGLGIIGARK